MNEPNQPMTTQPAYISVTIPVSRAIAWTKRILFQPFDLTKWMIIGFCAWLAGLGERGYSFPQFSGGGRSGGGRDTNGDFERVVEEVRTYVMSHLYWIIPVAIGIVVVLLVIGLTFLWLNC